MTMFDQVAIIGVGLLGGSLAKELKHRGLAKRVVGVCRSESTRDFALEEKLIDEAVTISQAAQSDLLVLATPMQTMLPILSELKQHIASSAIITDVGSVKGYLYSAIRDQHPELLSQCVFAHPIAGGEDSGVRAARLDLFTGKDVIITPTDDTDPSRLRRVSELWQACDARVIEMSLTEHDAVFAKTSHLPHAVAFTLVNSLHAQENRHQLFEMAAAGFYDFTRIASSDAIMWRDICVTNRDQLLASLKDYKQHLDLLIDAVADKDVEKIQHYFEQAKQARDQGLLVKGEKVKSEKKERS